MLDQRGRLLMAALGFAGCSMPSYDRALYALRSLLDSWSGIGRIVLGMARQGFDLQLTRYVASLGPHGPPSLVRHVLGRTRAG